MSSEILLTAHRGDSTTFTLLKDGTLIIRSVGDDGACEVYTQKVEPLPTLLAQYGSAESWKVLSAQLPPALQRPGNPTRIFLLSHPEFGRLVPFAIAGEPMTDDAAEILIEKLPQLILLIRNSQIFGREWRD